MLLRHITFDFFNRLRPMEGTARYGFSFALRCDSCGAAMQLDRATAVCDYCGRSCTLEAAEARRAREHLAELEQAEAALSEIATESARLRRNRVWVGVEVVSALVLAVAMAYEAKQADARNLFEMCIIAGIVFSVVVTWSEVVRKHFSRWVRQRAVELAARRIGTSHCPVCGADVPVVLTAPRLTCPFCESPLVLPEQALEAGEERARQKVGRFEGKLVTEQDSFEAARRSAEGVKTLVWMIAGALVIGAMVLMKLGILD